MGSAEDDLEFLQQKQRVRNPLVPVGELVSDFPFCSAVVLQSMRRCLYISGALMTAGVLTAGLISFRRGNSQLGQTLMRARVVVQGATVALMVGTAYFYGGNPWKSH